jgi:serine protease AprX
MAVTPIGRRWATVVCVVVAATVLGVGLAFAAPPAPAPISPHLAAQMAENPDGRFRVMVHGTDLAAADRAVAITGMTKHTDYRRVAVVVATAAAGQIEAARIQQGVTYIEGDQPLDFHNRPM